MVDDNMEYRLSRVERELDDIRDAVGKNTTNIRELSISVSALDAKVKTLVDELHELSTSLRETSDRYSNIIDSILQAQKEKSKSNQELAMKVVDTIAKVSLILLAAGLGLKAIGVI